MYPKNIQACDLEVSSKCNALCPMCQHSVNGGKINPLLPQKELSLKDTMTIFPPDLLEHLKYINICGNYGDPATCKDLLPICHYFKHHNPHISLIVFSNGSLRNAKWWSDLAGIIDVCHFGIDGLQDTNHLYRKNTNWDLIINNVQSFIKTKKARAIWDYLVFRHNEHQVEKAQQLSLELGFYNFRLKKSHRFNSESSYENRKGVENASGNLEYYLEPPTIPQFQSPVTEAMNDVLKTHETIEAYWDHTPIQCKAVQENKIYVSAEGFVFPCCWVSQIYNWNFPPETGEIWNLIKMLPEKIDELHGLKRPVTTIINSKFFHLLETSWKKDSLKNGKLKVCARICGQKIDPFQSQFT